MDELKRNPAKSARPTATRADLVIGSNAQIHALSKVYASSDAHKKFVQDFVSAWTKVINREDGTRLPFLTSVG